MKDLKSVAPFSGKNLMWFISVAPMWMLRYWIDLFSSRFHSMSSDIATFQYYTPLLKLYIYLHHSHFDLTTLHFVTLDFTLLPLSILFYISFTCCKFYSGFNLVSKHCFTFLGQILCSATLLYWLSNPRQSTLSQKHKTFIRATANLYSLIYQLFQFNAIWYKTFPCLLGRN